MTHRRPVECIREPDERSLEDLAAEREDWAAYLDLAIAQERIATELCKFPEIDSFIAAKDELLVEIKEILREREPVI